MAMLLPFCRCSGDILGIFCGYSVDILWIFCDHSRRRLCGNNFRVSYSHGRLRLVFSSLGRGLQACGGS